AAAAARTRASTKVARRRTPSSRARPATGWMRSYDLRTLAASRRTFAPCGLPRGRNSRVEAARQRSRQRCVQPACGARRSGLEELGPLVQAAIEDAIAARMERATGWDRGQARHAAVDLHEPLAIRGDR